MEFIAILRNMKDRFGNLIKPGSVLYSTRYYGFDLVLNVGKKSIMCVHINSEDDGYAISSYLIDAILGGRFGIVYINYIISPKGYISLKDGEVNKEIWKIIRIIKSELKMK